MKQILLLIILAIFNLNHFQKIFTAATKPASTTHGLQQKKLDAEEQKKVDLELLNEIKKFNNNKPEIPDISKIEELLLNGASVNNEVLGLLKEPNHPITRIHGNDPYFYDEKAVIFNILMPYADLNIKSNKNPLLSFASRLQNYNELYGEHYKNYLVNRLLDLLLNGADPTLKASCINIVKKQICQSFLDWAKRDKKLMDIYKEAQKEIQARSKAVREKIIEALPDMPNVLANIIAEYVHYLPQEENK